METRLDTIKSNTGIFGSEIRRNLMVCKYQVLMALISQVFNKKLYKIALRPSAATQGQFTQVGS